jgi:protease-4
LKPLEINQYVNEMDVLLAQYHGNTATAAMAAGLIDGVKTRDEANTYLIDKVGAVDEDGYFQGVDFDSYVWLRGFEDEQPESEAVVGIIVAKGMILDGRQPAGGIGGDSLAELIRQARTDNEVDAVVLRVDSGGGSPFASEIIRRELLLLQKSGKPLVVSMGSMAASGGYWISALADEIWATPTTLTGSIGIYGAFPTLDKTLARLGVHTDGVGTTELAGSMRLDRPLNPIAERVIQSSIEHGYEQFIDIVADGGGMVKFRVEKLAGGRVWSGADAYGNGLVDKLGGLEEAIAAAAELAELDDYRRQWIELPLSPQEQFIRELGGVLSPLGQTSMLSQWQRFAAPFQESIKLLNQMNDPRGIYVQCVACIAP